MPAIARIPGSHFLPHFLPGAESDYNTEDDFEGEEEAALEDDPCVVEARVFTWEGS